LGRGRTHYFQTLDAFKRTELIIVGGGGLFFDLPEHNFFLNNMLMRIDKALKKGKKVALIGVGIGPIHHDSSRATMKRILNRGDLIAVREPQSKSLLEDIGIDQVEIHVTADMALLMQPAKETEIDNAMKAHNLRRGSGPVVAVSLCGRHVNRPGYLEALTDCCRHIINKHDATVWFIPMQAGNEFNDQPGMEQIASKIGSPERIGILGGVHPPRVILGAINRTDFVIGERFHAAVFALICNKPMVGISYMPKVARLFDEISHSEWSIDLNELSPGQLETMIDTAWASRDKTPAELAAATDKMKSKALENFELLAGVINR